MMHTGMVFTKAMKGVKKESTMHSSEVRMTVDTEASPVMAMQPTHSP